MESVPDSPVHDADPTWSTLDAASKRTRILDAAEAVFTAHGFEATMPQVASAAGAGVGSLYRQFPSKEALVEALAVRRLETIVPMIAEATAHDDAWDGLRRLVDSLLGDDADDPVSARAVAARPQGASVAEARGRAHAALQALLDAGKRQGTVRADATHVDFIILIRSARAVRDAAPGAWQRCVTLMLDGLRPPRA